MNPPTSSRRPRYNRFEARVRRIQDPALVAALRRLHRLVTGNRRPGRPEQLELQLTAAR